MPPKRIAKRRSPSEDAIPKSKKVKGKLSLPLSGSRWPLGSLRSWDWMWMSGDFPSWEVSDSLLNPTLWESQKGQTWLKALRQWDK